MDRILNSVKFVVGNEKDLAKVKDMPVYVPFADNVLEFLSRVSKELLQAGKGFPDVLTLGFFLRKANLLQLKQRFICKNFRIGRGIVFHIAPSNVPVNYAYSLVTGLLSGNSNIVKIPSKNFSQVTIINNCIKKVLHDFSEFIPYIFLVRYGHEKTVNDYFSVLCNVRIIWGGDRTVIEIRKSPLRPRASDITFADRFSFVIINADKYLEEEKKKELAVKFYNDTYLTDQNACTSPSLIVWTGEKKMQAQAKFYLYLEQIVREKYDFQPIMSINKLEKAYVFAAKNPCEIVVHKNFIVRIRLAKVDARIIEAKGNSGYFFEYDCDDLMELRSLCNNEKVQTVSVLGDEKKLFPLLQSGIKGIDRIVSVGKTMDFDFIWDGMNIVERLTRVVKVGLE